jgi:hypothetical protein
MKVQGDLLFENHVLHGARGPDGGPGGLQ